MNGINLNNADVEKENLEIDKNIFNLNELYNKITKLPLEKLISLHFCMLLKDDDYNEGTRILDNFIDNIIQKRIDYIADNDSSFEEIKMIFDAARDINFFKYKIPNSLIIKYFKYLDEDQKINYFKKLDFESDITNSYFYPENVDKIELLKLYCEDSNESILSGIFSNYIIHEKYLELLLKVENKNIKKLARYAEKYSKIRFFPTNRTIFSYKLDTKIDCHLFPIIEKMVSIGIKCIDHCHGNHIFKFSESYELDYDLIVKSAYIQFEYLNSENENSLIKYAQKRNMFIDKLYHLDNSKDKEIIELLGVSGSISESDLNLCFNTCKCFNNEDKTKLINLLDCHSFEYKISAFNLDLRDIDVDLSDNYIHEIYVKNDKFIQDLYDYFI